MTYGNGGKPKGRPRGKPFQRGADPRRYGSESLGLYNDQKEQLQQMQEQTAKQLEAVNGPKAGDPCPTGCGGTVADRTGRFGAFLGCSRFPRCRWTTNPLANPITTEGEVTATRVAPVEVGQKVADLFTQLAATVAAPVDEAKVRQLIAAEIEEARKGAADAAAAVESKVLDMIRQAVKEIEPPTIRVQLEGGEEVKVKTLEGLRHHVTDTVLQRIGAGFKNILLVGPGGSGKTTLAHRIAEALDLPFASVSCSAGMSEGVLLGRLLPTGEGGRFEYAEAPFVKCYEGGGVFLLDEVDAADANVLLVLNSAMANGHLDVPNRLHNPVARRHPRFVLLAAGNTWGLGANRQYVGRNQLDAAFLDRFAGAVLEMGYDRKLEAGIARGWLGDEAGQAWAERIWAIRERIEQTGLRRIWGTRALVSGAMLQKAGVTQTDALKALTVGWTPDEVTKAGVA